MFNVFTFVQYIFALFLMKSDEIKAMNTFFKVPFQKQHYCRFHQVFYFSRNFGNYTIMIPSFWTVRQVWANSVDPDQEQSDQGLHCLPFGLHLLGALFYGKTTLIKFENKSGKRKISRTNNQLRYS